MFRKWWLPIAAVLISGVAGVVFMGIRTYQDAPPIPSFVDGNGKVIVSNESILDGQLVFQKYALRNYGSMFGDGAGRERTGLHSRRASQCRDIHDQVLLRARASQ